MLSILCESSPSTWKISALFPLSLVFSSSPARCLSVAPPLRHVLSEPVPSPHACPLVLGPCLELSLGFPCLVSSPPPPPTLVCAQTVTLHFVFCFHFCYPLALFSRSFLTFSPLYPVFLFFFFALQKSPPPTPCVLLFLLKCLPVPVFTILSSSVSGNIVDSLLSEYTFSLTWVFSLQVLFLFVDSGPCFPS